MAGLLGRFNTWRRQRVLGRNAIDDALWSELTASLDLLAGMSAAELAELRELTALLDGAKRFSGAHDFVVDARVRVTILAQAAVLILGRPKVGLDPFPGWLSVIVYPGAFLAHRVWVDDAGVEHHTAYPADGETSDFGPVLISWDDARPGARDTGSGRNVVVHEFAHQLDFANTWSDGYPILPRGMSPARWSEVWINAFDRFRASLGQPDRAAFDPYAASAPAEFFAVLSEAFFLRPDTLHAAFPDVFEQLLVYYNQDPRPRRGLATARPSQPRPHGPLRWAR